MSTPRRGQVVEKLCGAREERWSAGEQRGAPASPAPARNTLLGADDVDAQLGGDVGVEPDRDRVLAERLDRLVERDAPALDAELVLIEERRDVLAGHRAEQLAFLAGLALLFVREPFDPRLQAFGIRLDARRLRVLVLLDHVEILQIARRGRHGEFLRDQEIAGVTV